MLGSLQPAQMEDVLAHQCIGRLACHADGETYIVPISYAYDGTYIYCHSYEGKKLRMMRANPKVCFEVDEFRDMANWQSVVVKGEYQELKEKGQRNGAIDVLLNRHLPVISSETTHLGEHWPFHPTDNKEIDGVVFRIAINEKTGRFEFTSQSPALPG